MDFYQLRISVLVKGGKTFIYIPVKDGAKSNNNGLRLGRWLTGSILLCEETLVHMGDKDIVPK